MCGYFLICNDRQSECVELSNFWHLLFIFRQEPIFLEHFHRKLALKAQLSEETCTPSAAKPFFYTCWSSNHCWQASRARSLPGSPSRSISQRGMGCRKVLYPESSRIRWALSGWRPAMGCAGMTDIISGYFSRATGRLRRYRHWGWKTYSPGPTVRSGS